MRQTHRTAYMTDTGMTGDYDSVIGMEKEEPARRFTTGLPATRFEPAISAATLCGVAVELDDKGSRSRSRRCGSAAGSPRRGRAFGNRHRRRRLQGLLSR